MSILSQLFEGKIGFSQAASEAEKWASQVVAHDPTFTAAAGNLLSIVKQGASEAIMLADTALGPLIAPAAHTVETSLESALAAATGGATVVLNPAIDSTIDQMASVVKSTADAWALAAKARLTQPAPPA